MKTLRIVSIVGTFTIALVSLMALHAAAAPAPALEITYIANDGFMLAAGGRKVLVDAIFSLDTDFGIIPSPQMLSDMTQAKPPFADVDLLLVTHAHGDHGDPKLLISFLRSHPNCRLIAHQQMVETMKPEEGFTAVESQVVIFDLKPGERQKVSINGIDVEAVCLDHARPQVDIRVLMFDINMGAARVLHFGDTVIGQNSAYLANYPFERAPVDLVFLNFFVTGDTARDMVVQRMKARHVAAMHFEKATLKESSEKFRTVFPDALIFEQPMERRVLSLVPAATSISTYFDQPPPSATPEVFARGFISTDRHEHSAPTFSPDGNEVYWSLFPSLKDGELQVIMTMRRKSGAWSVPTVADFSGEYSDGGPVFSADGRRIYFSSIRPTPSGVTSEDIWFVEKQDGIWSEPRCLEFLARFPEMKSSFQPSLTRNGTLYFTVRPSSLPPKLQPNEFLIYRAELIDGKYAKPEPLPSAINAPGAFVNWTPFIAPDESYLLFSSARQHRGGDVFIAHRAPDGTWSQPEILPETINTPRQERFASVSLDGRCLYFTRRTPGYLDDVYWVSTEDISALHHRDIPNNKTPK